MPALFTFLFKVNIALLLFCLGYYLVLRHLTFYTLNRIYLVAAILFSSIYPWINISGFLQRHQQLTAPVQNVILQWKAPAENLVKPLNQPNYWYWTEVIFWAGAILFALRLAVQLFSLYRLYRNSQPGRIHNYPVRLIDGNVGPFSFWRSIFVNPATLAPSDLEKVLEHEHVHVSEWHTLDILLAELSTIFYWFNPGIWLMKRAVRENIEFITDRKILQRGVDSKQYQYSLLSVSMAGTPNTLVNNFNISTIKKRIIMMNAKRSSRIKLSRYVLVAPVVIILLLVFSISKAEITLKGLIRIKSSVSAAIKSVAITSDDRAVIHPAALPEKVKITQKAKTKPQTSAADTIYAGRSKDGKKNMLVTSDKSLDSVGYVINGAKATKQEVKALDPGKIKSLDMVSAEQAQKFIDFRVDKSEILFITTDDSEKGKYLKDRLDKAMGGGTLARAKNMAVGSTVESADTAPVAAAYGTGVSTSSSNSSSDNAPEVAVYTNSKTISSNVAVAKPTKIYVKSDLKNHVYVTSPKTVVSVNGAYTVAPKVAADQALVLSDAPKAKGKGMVYLNYKPNDETTLDGPGDKLIIIDGKEAKSLKNISAEDIKSMTILKNEAAKKKYGDKGKNGVIIITTQKGSK